MGFSRAAARGKARTDDRRPPRRIQEGPSAPPIPESGDVLRSDRAARWISGPLSSSKRISSSATAGEAMSPAFISAWTTTLSAYRPRCPCAGASEDPGVSIVVQSTHEDGLPKLLQEDPGRSPHQAAIHSFDLLGRVCLVDLALGGAKESLARAIHEDYVREQRKIGQSPGTNPSLVSWEDLPETLKESNRSQADHIGTKLKAVGCAIEVATDWREPLVHLQRCRDRADGHDGTRPLGAGAAAGGLEIGAKGRQEPQDALSCSLGGIERRPQGT